MKRIFKLILLFFVVIIIAGAVVIALASADVAASLATSSQTLTPNGTSVGKAIVVYDHGLSGAAKSIADKIAVDLQTKGYTVVLAGIKSSAAKSTSGYSVIVVGGPVYGGTPSRSVQAFLNGLNPTQGTKVGVFGSGDFPTNFKVAPLSSHSTLTITYSAKINFGENQSTLSQEFVNHLLS